MCYQRPNHNSNTNNHGNDKPTHIPHSPFGHKWTEPYFDLQMPRNVTSLVGKSAYLGCRVRNLGNKTVAWIRHRDLHILTVGTYTYTTDQRFQTSFHRDIDEWTLQIKWAQKRDAGAYECQISTQPVRAFSVNLNIVESIITDTDNLLQQYYSDDAFLINSDRFYQRGEDEFAGLFPMKTIAVPTATILGGPDLYVDKGSTINLTCAIKFSPEPPTHIFWYHQDKVLSEDSERGGISFVTSKADFSKSILLIESADLPDSGKYSCYPSNTEIASIRVHVLNGERPEAMQTSGASRTTLTLIGYHPTLRKLKSTSTTITTILTTIYSTTIIIHIIMAAILLKIFTNFLYYLNNNCWNNINTTTTTTKSTAVKNIKSIIKLNDINCSIRDNNRSDNDLIITEEENDSSDSHNKIIDINKKFLKFSNKFKEYYNRNNYYQNHHYHHQHYYQHHFHKRNCHKRQEMQLLKIYEENNCNSYYCNSSVSYCCNDNINPNASNATIHYNIQQQQQQQNKNKSYYNNNVNDFCRRISKTSNGNNTRTTTTTTTTHTTSNKYSQLRTTTNNYLLKSSSQNNVNGNVIKNYNDEMNYSYRCCCCNYDHCCQCFQSNNNEKNIAKYREQVSL